MSESGCYYIHLYCDSLDEYDPGGFEQDSVHDFREFPHEYTGSTRGDCRNQARSNGWLIKRNGQTFCPKCSGKEKSK